MFHNEGMVSILLLYFTFFVPYMDVGWIDEVKSVLAFLDSLEHMAHSTTYYRLLR